ncbi:MFS transporter [Neisseria gonorrhoeae]|uniref:MFS superfamily transporter n=8 Tax=Neisseria TaxID=482 RepID=X5F9C9_NEIME|nr:transporter, MFS superfamily [Neisseria gonorrhoeae NCCP11945]AHW76637.1 MFS superfamily transporter [Neisseria meningitidis]ARB98098.1 MFS transporter [Neisseria gonorrhoeae]EFE04699.1 conserved hypothetical protein [Neisseria gonorrhoeae DGI2]EFM05360.1 hypothetical protein HMPREF0602_0153 [Neisseria meningitidis ATCC 13091]EFV63841.1 hypothetical protein NMH_0620 [Neisseria meningitidis H44/76]KER40570.1 transporter, MFS superfamily [Neisseria meningitidis 992008]CBA03861.1 hypothetica
MWVCVGWLNIVYNLSYFLAGTVWGFAVVFVVFVQRQSCDMEKIPLK